MYLTEFLLAEFDREVERSRRALEQTPEGKYDWRPHEKSMVFGYLANMVATIPSWVAMQINLEEFDVAPVDGPKMEQKRMGTSAELLEAPDKAAALARSAFGQHRRAFNDFVAIARRRTGSCGGSSPFDDSRHD